MAEAIAPGVRYIRSGVKLTFIFLLRLGPFFFSDDRVVVGGILRKNGSFPPSFKKGNKKLLKLGRFFMFVFFVRGRLFWKSLFLGIKFTFGAMPLGDPIEQCQTSGYGIVLTPIALAASVLSKLWYG